MSQCQPVPAFGWHFSAQCRPSGPALQCFHPVQGALCAPWLLLRRSVEAQTELPKMASMRASRMHDDGIGRYPTISVSPCVRTRRTRRPSPRPERPTRMPSRRERRHSARLPPRPDGERYVRTVRDPMVPIGGRAVGIGSHSLARNGPKGRFSPREAPSSAATR